MRRVLLVVVSLSLGGCMGFNCDQPGGERPTLSQIAEVHR